MPSIFRLRRITFLQAAGLLSLCRILLGRGFQGRRGTGDEAGKSDWDEMTPEQWESFRKRLRRRCGDFEPPVEGVTGKLIVQNRSATHRQQTSRHNVEGRVCVECCPCS
jgi:hypothetical protein